MTHRLSSRPQFLAEFSGTAALLTVIVGSGIMGESLAQGNAAIALLANSLATGAGLFVLIQCLSPISGAHLNPAVSLVEYFRGRLSAKGLAAYSITQVLGAILGVWIAHLMFSQAVIQISTKTRSGAHLWFSEIVATFGLISTIALAERRHAALAPLSVAAYVASAYWFSSSTSFANPAVTLARSLTNTFCGISPASAPAFIAAQVTGAMLAFLALRKTI